MRLLYIFLVPYVEPTCDIILEKIWLTNYEVEWRDLINEEPFCQGLEYDYQFWQFLPLANKKSMFCSNAKDLNSAQQLIWNDWKQRNNLNFKC